MTARILVKSHALGESVLTDICQASMCGSPLMGKVQILIAGIPASGKSTFGKWLADTNGFVHIDMELDDSVPGSLGKNGLRSEWDAFWQMTDCERFLEAVKGRASSVALDWGFPPNPRVLSVVSKLKAGGVRPWWFDGDRLAARALFESRGTKSVRDFDHQFALISDAWAQISLIVGDHVVRTVQPDGSVMHNTQIFSTIIGDRHHSEDGSAEAGHLNDAR